MVVSSSTEQLFTPLKVGDITLGHRVVMAPLTRTRANDAHVHQQIATEYYGQRASPGTLLISEATFIRDEAGGIRNVPGIWSDHQIAAWKQVTDAVHQKGGFIFLQLWALGRAADPKIMAEKGFSVISSGNVPIEEGRVAPTPLTKDEILQYVEWYAQAAKNAVHEAGFDGVEIHGANGYLIDQFLQTNSNNRTDEFGGSIENRARFVLLVAKAVTDVIGQEKTGIRFSPHGHFQGMRMSDELMEEQFTYVIKALREAFPTFAYMHLTEPRVTGGADAKPEHVSGTIDFARRAWGDVEGSPFLAAGGYTRETAIETAEKYGGAIVFGRDFIANPDLPLRLKYDVPLNKYDRSTFYTKGPKGIDVGTGSARAAIVSQTGEIVASSAHETKLWRNPSNPAIFEQSTSDTWAQITSCVRKALEDAKISPEQIKGIGFDATCSLAVTDLDGKPISISEQDRFGEPGERDIILWSDHRAEKEANEINQSSSEVLQFVGGVMSLEMEIPKILWLKRHLSEEQFAKCLFFDLPDYLTYRATGSQVRSNCSLVCKTSFVPPGVTELSMGFDPDFLNIIGMPDLARDTKRIGGGGVVLTAGLPVGSGLSNQSAQELGLLEGTPVGSAVIDAYAGWIGTVAARYKTGSTTVGKGLSDHPSIQESTKRLAAVAGTSTCHLAQSKNGIFVPGVWGPYKDAVFPGWWMNEGGQSATGQLIDFVIKNHPAYPELKVLSSESKESIHDILEAKLEELRQVTSAAGGTLETFTGLTKDVHMYPDFHGNRSPLADSKMRGSISGLSLDNSIIDLALKFNVTLEAIALQTRHILDEMNGKGHDIDSIYMSGSQAHNKPLMQLIADVCRVPVILPHSPSAAVVVGAAMLGRFAAEVSETHGKPDKAEIFCDQKTAANVGMAERERLWEIMVEMTQPGTRVEPAASLRDERLLQAKYKIFRESIEIQRRWRKEMEDAAKNN
ncbi:hypothetical protein FRB97_003050 [Tulasnella sp. 331]|nr:hypothetical protein FRB97_003050 [Tulasnella sp. 331]